MRPRRAHPGHLWDTPLAATSLSGGRCSILGRQLAGGGAAVLLLWVEMLTESDRSQLIFETPPLGMGSLTSGLASQRIPARPVPAEARLSLVGGRDFPSSLQRASRVFPLCLEGLGPHCCWRASSHGDPWHWIRSGPPGTVSTVLRSHGWALGSAGGPDRGPSARSTTRSCRGRPTRL